MPLEPTNAGVDAASYECEEATRAQNRCRALFGLEALDDRDDQQAEGEREEGDARRRGSSLLSLMGWSVSLSLGRRRGKGSRAVGFGGVLDKDVGRKSWAGS